LETHWNDIGACRCERVRLGQAPENRQIFLRNRRANQDIDVEGVIWGMISKEHRPDFSVRGKIALVTGSARGIGRECALTLAAAGADIAIGLKNIQRDEGLEEEIQDLGRKSYRVQLDMRNMKQIGAAADLVMKEFGRIDILVNNAGIAPANLAADVTETDYDDTVNVNLKGTFFLSQAIGRQMIKQRSGRIINLGSQAGFIALPSESIYCMTKAAISHLTKCLAVEWGPYNINVNAVAPTFIHTPGTEKWLMNEEFRKDVLSNIVLGRIGEPSDVAAAVLYLASPASQLITGTTLLIDGGWTAK
jgi:NAD(P)-dependent dehydrogenase (short-subunit alcohol dehydrogenase family)